MQRRRKTKSFEETQESSFVRFENDPDHINVGEEDQMEIYGYKRNATYTTATWFLIMITCGVLRLVFHWVPSLMLLATHSRCSLDEAEAVLLIEKFQGRHTTNCYVKKIRTVTPADVWSSTENGSISENKLSEVKLKQNENNNLIPLSYHLTGGLFKETKSIKSFTCKKLIYIWDSSKREYLKLQGLDKSVPISTFHDSLGLTSAQQIMRRGIYGNNEMLVPVQGFFTLLGLEILNPFYVFQLLSFCMWICYDYICYAIVIFVISACGVVMAALQTQRNQKNLHSTVVSSDTVTVLRDKSSGKTDDIPVKYLVPSDILVIPSHSFVLPCDAVLLNGNCTVNESLLTGESVPVTKTPSPCDKNVLYDDKEHAKHTLYSGTKILQTRHCGSEKVLAVVIRTGFNTSKGSLIRSIMYPPPVDYKFEQDSYKFVKFLACLACIGVIYTIVTKAQRGVSNFRIFLEALDLVTVVVPPSLPAAMTVGRLIAQSRLEEKKIYCTSPRTINVSGSIDCICFDKTGTLTQDDLDMWGIVSVCFKKFQPPNKNILMLPTNDLLLGMVTCHSIAIIDGQLMGDPLDLKIFQSTEWILEEPNANNTSKHSIPFQALVRPKNLSGVSEAFKIGIVKQFPFESALQRMSVITKTNEADGCNVYCKGSPEMILKLSKIESIPSNFDNTLQEYTSKGFRVIALASKSVQNLSDEKVQSISRETAETDLDFLGFVIFENRLKAESKPTISALNDAMIKVVMVTGDNMLTALSVAKDCDIIKPDVAVITVTAVTGRTKPQVFLTKDNQGNADINFECNLEDVDDDDNGIKIDGNVGDLKDFLLHYLSEDNRHSKTDYYSLKPNDYAFSVTGQTWALLKMYYPDLLSKLVIHGAIFARMSPDQKQQLVQELKDLGFNVAMVGDGANDCGALKAAHTGISLSESESSVASPFTSRTTNISCALAIIREGRAALVTSFGIFKYMAGYSLTQFISVMLLYSIDSNLTDIQYLYIDLFIISVFSFFFGQTEAYDGPLYQKPPLTSLVNPTPILSLLMQTALVATFQFFSLWQVREQDWFVPYNATITDSAGCLENYVIFIVSSMQYIILAVVFSQGPPYRKSIWTNSGLLASFIILSIFSTYLCLCPSELFTEWFELILPKDIGIRYYLIVCGLANFVIAMFVEYFIIDYLASLQLIKKLHGSEKF